MQPTCCCYPKNPAGCASGCPCWSHPRQAGSCGPCCARSSPYCAHIFCVSMYTYAFKFFDCCAMKSRGLKLLFPAFCPLMVVEGRVARVQEVEPGRCGGGVDPLRIHQHADPGVVSLAVPCRMLSLPSMRSICRMGSCVESRPHKSPLRRDQSIDLLPQQGNDGAAH